MKDSFIDDVPVEPFWDEWAKFINTILCCNIDILQTESAPKSSARSASNSQPNIFLAIPSPTYFAKRKGPFQVKTHFNLRQLHIEIICRNTSITDQGQLKSRSYNIPL